MRSVPLTLSAALLSAALPSFVAAQQAWAGARIQSYVMTDAEAVRLHDVRLVTVPFGGRSSLASWANLSLVGAYADAVMTLPNGETGGVSGITDTRVTLQGTWRGLALSGVAVLPTGEVVRSVEEATTAGFLASELLPFAATQWGTGGAYGADVTWTFPIDRTRLALSAGVLEIGESTPLEGGADPLGAAAAYQPGSQIRVRAVVDTEVGEASVLSVLLGVQMFGTDTYDEQNLFSPGKRLESLVSYAFPLGARESAVVFGGFYDRSAGSLVWTLALPPDLGDVFPGASPSTSRQLFLAGSELRISRRRFDVTPRGEVRILRSAEGLGQGWLASAGGHAGYRVGGERFGRRVLLEPSAALRFGHIVPQEGAESNVVGVEAGLTVRWEGGR